MRSYLLVPTLLAASLQPITALRLPRVAPKLPQHLPQLPQHFTQCVATAATGAALVCMPSPAVAAAKVKAIPFTLWGYSSSQLYPIQNLSLISWLLYLLLPRWKLTPALALISPVVHSLLYGQVLAHMVRNPVPGMSISFSTLEGLMPGFSLPDGVFAGWLHYCTFDPLVGLAIVLDAKRKFIPHLLCVPCIVLTALAGPVGFVSYLALRTLVLGVRGKKPLEPPRGFAWGKTF